MKKILLSLILCICLSGCGTENKENDNLLNNPNDIEIAKLLEEKLDGVKSTCVVTEDNDPNGNLNKQGGYIGAVYFRLQQVDDVYAQKEYSVEISDDACDAGTSGGGQIEIYSNSDDAKKRDEYLSALDGFLSGGHHQQYNSIIIRISDELTATQQKELTEVIYDLLITN